MHDKLKLLLIVAFLFYLLPYFISDQIFAPDELDYRFFGNLLAEEGKLSFVAPYDDLFGFKGSIPRHFTYNKFGEVVPQGFQGFIVLIAIFQTLLPDSWIFMINPLLAVLVLFLVYKISYVILGDKKYALLSSSFLATTPVFIHWTNFYMPDMLNVALFLAAFLCLLKALHTGELLYYLGLGLFCGLLYWTRYTSILLLVPVASFVLVRRERFHFGKILLSTILFLVTIGLALIYHFHVYGKIFEMRHNSHIYRYINSDITAHLTESQIDESVLQKLLKPELSALLYHFKTAPAILSLAYPPLFLALLGLFVGWQNNKSKEFILFVGILAVTIFPLFGNYYTYGFALGELTLHSSFLRYLLPLFVLLPIATTIALYSLKGPTRQMALVIIGVNLFTAIIAPHGIIESIASKIYFQKTAEFILHHTDENTVVISAYWDKVVYPQRITYGHPEKLSQTHFQVLVENIISTGFKIAYIDHKHNLRDHQRNERRIGQLSDSTYEVTHIQGPPIESEFFRTIRNFAPSDLYPVNMYLIAVRDSHQEEGHILPESLTEPSSE